MADYGSGQLSLKVASHANFRDMGAPEHLRLHVMLKPTSIGNITSPLLQGRHFLYLARAKGTGIYCTWHLLILQKINNGESFPAMNGFDFVRKCGASEK